MRLLVTGALGQLGTEVVAAFEGHDVIATDLPELDITDRDAVLSAVTALAPDAIVNCAAFTAVDDCEARPELAFALNAMAVRYLVEAAARVGGQVCQISTDYVFDGEKAEPYHEWDATGPRSVYGSSKLAGEHELRPEDLLVRTSWLCSANGPNMVATILRLAGEHDELRFVDDQRGHPSFAPDVAAVIRRLIGDRRTGRYHVTNQGAGSWYEFARAVLAASGADPDRVSPIATADLDPPRPAYRPANSVLDNRALRLAGLPVPPHYEEPLAALVGVLAGS